MNDPEHHLIDHIATPLPRPKHVFLGVFFTVFSMETALRAAGVAFFGFLSIFPVIASSVLIFGLIADASILVPLLDWLRPFVPEAAMEVIDTRLEAILDQPRSGLGIGLVISLTIALWSGTRGINALVQAIADTEGEVITRSFPAAVGLSIVLTFGGLFFVGIALTAIAAIPPIVNFFSIPDPAASLIMLLRWPVLLLIIIASLFAVYFLASGRGADRRHPVWPGALLASILWIVVSLAFSFYVENLGSFEATFGSLSATVVLLLWLYNSAVIVIAGAALNAHFTREHTPALPERESELNQALKAVTSRPGSR